MRTLPRRSGAECRRAPSFLLLSLEPGFFFLSLRCRRRAQLYDSPCSALLAFCRSVLSNSGSHGAKTSCVDEPCLVSKARLPATHLYTLDTSLMDLCSCAAAGLGRARGLRGGNRLAQEMSLFSVCKRVCQEEMSRTIATLGEASTKRLGSYADCKRLTRQDRSRADFSSMTVPRIATSNPDVSSLSSNRRSGS